MLKITVSYRRTDSDAITGRIFDRLVEHYGRESIFRDIDSIPPGIDFRNYINDALHETSILLVVVGPKWLGSKGGRARIDDDADPVRIEVETAMKLGITVIPILIGNTKMPSISQLPDSIKDFAFRNAVHIDPGADFEGHCERLTRAMDLLLRDKFGVVRPAHLVSAGPDSGDQPQSRMSVIEVLFSFKGRISRKTYWKATLAYYAMICLTGILLGVYFLAEKLQAAGSDINSLRANPFDNWRSQLLLVIVVAPFYWPYFALLLKRVHDIGQGWQLLSVFILGNILLCIFLFAGYSELYNWTVIILITMQVLVGCIPGQPGPNRYGPDPLRKTEAAPSR